MVFACTTLRVMDTDTTPLVRMASVDSLGSTGSDGTAQAGLITSCEEVTAETHLSQTGNKDIYGTNSRSDCSALINNHSNTLEESEYITSASVREHFPQKVFTSTPPSTRLSVESAVLGEHCAIKASTGEENRVSSPFNAVRSDITSESQSQDTCAFGASELSSHTPEDTSQTDCLTSSRSALSSVPSGASTSGNDGSSGVRFLPAYKEKSVEEMLRDQSPRAIWQPNTKCVKSHSESNMRRRSQGGSLHGPPLPRNLSAAVGAYGVSHNTLPHHVPPYNSASHNHIPHVQTSLSHPRNLMLRATPPGTLSLRKTNDGTHPRMAPIRATAQQTYYGQPLHLQGTRLDHSRPGDVSPRTARNVERSPMANTTPDFKRVRMAPESARSYAPSQTVRAEAERKIAGSDNDIPRFSQSGQGHPQNYHSQGVQMRSRGAGVPSGTYIASSSMSNLPQYAQLMQPLSRPEPPAAHSYSVGAFADPAPIYNRSADIDTRHSYTAGMVIQQRVDSYSNIDEQRVLGQHSREPPAHHQGTQQQWMLAQRALEHSPAQTQQYIPTNRSCDSLDDVFDGQSLPVNRRHTLIGLPPNQMSRQDSYLTAVTANQRKQEILASNSLVQSERPKDISETESPILLRQKSTGSDSEAQAKILRRTSYLMATSKPDMNNLEDSSKSNSAGKVYNIRKLKSFFGEKTPSIKEAQDKLRHPSVPDSKTLPEKLDVIKSGILAVKVVERYGKKATDRSWKAMGAALCGQLLYLLKDRKENANLLMSPSPSFVADEKPLSIRACQVDIAYTYTKKRHVFRLRTSSDCEYMLQAEDHADMMAWIKVIMAQSTADREKISHLKSEQLSSAELIKRISDQQAKLVLQKKKAANLTIPGKVNSPANRASDLVQKKGDKKKIAVKQLKFGDSEPSGDFGIPLEECDPSHENEFVPLVVELCTKAIEERGLQFVGIYRVPGNKAAVEALKMEINRGTIDMDNDRWKDTNVLSSLLKTFFRKLPDPLVTAKLYKTFIETNRIADPKSRLIALKKLIRTLPEFNYETLKYLANHLRKVARYGDINKMDTRNLAIVFGPTIVRSNDDVMSLVTDMSDQYRIIESIILYNEWMFSDDDLPPPELEDADNSVTSAPISETLNNLGDDIAQLAGTKKSQSQLMSALNQAVNRNISSRSIGTDKGKAHATSASDDYDYKEERNLDEEIAARDLKYANIELGDNKKSAEVPPIIPPKGHRSELSTNDARMYSTNISREQNGHSQLGDNCGHLNHHLQVPLHRHEQHVPHHSLQRRHSEESILTVVDHHCHLPCAVQWPNMSNHITSMENVSCGSAPPIPLRGEEVKPPLPPKPMQLCFAKPARIHEEPRSLQNESAHGFINLYENYSDLQGSAKHSKNSSRFIRGISVLQSPTFVQGTNIVRRGSLDSMMEVYEPFHYSTSSSDSEDGTDLLTSITATFDEKLKLLVNPKYRLDGSGSRRHSNKTSSETSSVSSIAVTPQSINNSLVENSRRSASDRSRESLQSVQSNKENISGETTLSREPGSSDKGFHGSDSSISSIPPSKSEARIGIASRIERKDIKPIAVTPAVNNTVAIVVNATGSVVTSCEIPKSNVNSNKEHVNNNTVFQDQTSITQRRMSDEKKRIRRRHTVGGARDFEEFNAILDNHAKHSVLCEDTINSELQLQRGYTALQRLQPHDAREPLTLREWLERERFRASSPELELHTTPHIMHLQKVGHKLASSVLESNM